MNKICIDIKHVQHIETLTFEVDLSVNRLLCLVGKNGAGKTTLIKAFKNLKQTDTFAKTSIPYIFSEKSVITYTVDENTTYEFTYDQDLKTIDTNAVVSDDVKGNIYSELPLPFGDRFRHFQKLGELDEKIREKVNTEEYTSPDELIGFLQRIYNSDRFNNLKEIEIRGQKYYVIPKGDGYYIREDYFSSGEYFIISIYKLIQNKCKLIVVDELDISLDSIAQVNIIKELRKFCRSYHVNIIFTTHSLAIMKMLETEELYYMENIDGICTFENKSYNYIKALLYKFEGWDKYILTEDDVLQHYLEYILQDEPIFNKYKIIYIAGGSNVVDLMIRNSKEEFFSSNVNVLTVLDGDQKDEKYCKDIEQVFFLPFNSVEKQIKIHYDKEELDFHDIGIEKNIEKNGKDIFYKLTHKFMSEAQIFQYLNARHETEVLAFKKEIVAFLNDD